MQITSEDYKTEIKKPSRDFECKITIGNNIYTNNDIVDIILETVQPQEGFSIGNTPSQALDLTLLNRGDTIYSTSQVKVEIGLKIGSTIEYILMGYFNIDDIEKTDYTTKFTCYDNMIKFETPYFSSLTYPATLQQVANELATKTGVQFTGSLPAYNVKKLEGFTCREILGCVASVCGGNALINREGKFSIVAPKDINYSISADNYFDYKREEVKYKIGKVSCKTEDKELNKGSLGTDSMEIQFENPWVNESILNDIYTKLNGFSYLGYSMKWQGDLALDPGDIVAITDKKGIVRKVPILSQKFTYTGGLTTEIGAKGETKNKNSFSSSGHGSNKLDRVVTELLIVNEALIDKANIQQLEAVSIRTQLLEVKTAKVENAIIDVAHISDLTAINANIERLIATDATIEKAIIGKADIVDLKATNGKITLLETKVGSIDTILSKEIFAELISAGKIVAGSSIIAEGAIGSAQISSLSATKLSAGIIDAAVITVKNLNADNITVGSINGQRIAEGAIDNSKVAEGANIAGNKLNINDVIVNINGATTQINGTKIQVGDRTLDVELSTQKILVEENKVNISNQQATIKAMDDGIKLKVDNQTFNVFKDTTESNMTIMNTSLSKNTASIDILQREINLKVSQTDVDKSIKELEIGVRNLLRRSKLDYVPTSSTGTGTISEVVNDSLQGMVLHTNKQYVHGVELYVPKESLNVGDQITLSMLVRSKSKGIFTCQLYNTATISDMITISSTTEWQWLSYTKTIVGDPNSKDSRLYIYFTPDNEYWIKCIKIEKGNKATDWTPAPEDIDQAINTVDTKINTKVSEINLKLDSITLRVGKTESSTLALDGKVTDLSARVTAAEIKITDDSIVSTVRKSTAYKGDLNGKANQSDLATAESNITQLAESITHKVESAEFSTYKVQTAQELSQRVKNGEFNSYKQQTATEMSSKVSEGNFGSMITQNAKSVQIAFGNINTTNIIRNGSFRNGFVEWFPTDNKWKPHWKPSIWDNNTEWTLRDDFAKDGTIGSTMVLEVQPTIPPNTVCEFGMVSTATIRPLVEYTVTALLAVHRGILEARVTALDKNYGKIKTVVSVPVAMQTGGSTETGYYKLDKTFTTPANAYYIEVAFLFVKKGADAGGSFAFINKVKLEVGDKATGWTPHPSEIGGTFVDINDGEGLTVRGGALQVKSKEGRLVFSADDAGYIYNEYGVGTVVKPGEIISVRGIPMADDKCSTLLRAFGLWHESRDDKYNMRIASKTEIWFKNLADEWQDIRCKWSYASQFRTGTGNMAILRENQLDSGSGRMWINYGGGSPGNISKTLIGDGMNAGSYGELHCGTFFAHGTKNRAVDTQSFGTLALSAFETAESYFSDIKRNEVKDNICIIPIDPKLLQTINTHIQYEVVTWPYGKGQVYADVDEMHPTHFTVRGDDIKFGWQLIAKQRGYENNRLEQVQI